MGVDFFGQHLDSTCQALQRRGQLMVVFCQGKDLPGLVQNALLLSAKVRGDVFSMPGVSLRKRPIAIRLARLRKKNQRSSISRLDTEGEVEQDEWVLIKREGFNEVQKNPSRDDNRLRHKEKRSAQESNSLLGRPGKPIATKHIVQLEMIGMKPEVMRISII